MKSIRGRLIMVGEPHAQKGSDGKDIQKCIVKMTLQCSWFSYKLRCCGYYVLFLLPFLWLAKVFYHGKLKFPHKAHTKLLTIQRNIYCCFLCAVDGNWGAWGNWSTCSATCGHGTVHRTRTCDNPAPSNGGKPCAGEGHETAECRMTPCPCKWNSMNLWFPYFIILKEALSHMNEKNGLSVFYWVGNFLC